MRAKKEMSQLEQENIREILIQKINETSSRGESKEHLEMKLEVALWLIKNEDVDLEEIFFEHRIDTINQKVDVAHINFSDLHCLWEIGYITPFEERIEGLLSVCDRVLWMPAHVYDNDDYMNDHCHLPLHSFFSNEEFFKEEQKFLMYSFPLFSDNIAFLFATDLDLCKAIGILNRTKMSRQGFKNLYLTKEGGRHVVSILKKREEGFLNWQQKLAIFLLDSEITKFWKIPTMERKC